MQVILKNDVDHLGYKNDVVDVKRGYWRNFLRPRGLAEQASAALIREVADSQERRRSLEASNASEAEELKLLLDRTTIEIGANAGAEGRLFGSVTALDISRVLEATRKLRLDTRKITLDAPLKTLGTYQVPINLGHGVTAELTVEVTEQKLTEEQLARLEGERKAAEEAEIAAQLKAEAKAKAAAEAGNAPAVDADANAEATDADADVEAPEVSETEAVATADAEA
ncbi:MAG: 50S ribosomal protein L9 [Thermoleophilia bacterium]|nr:50S ribosomal protein L9 [Thermoleophilia bacterium]